MLMGLVMLVGVAVQDPLIAEAEANLSHDAVEPTRVQFRAVRRAGNVVCGEINRPNRQGGMDGFSQFAYFSRSRWVLRIPEAEYWLMDEHGFVSTATLWQGMQRYEPGSDGYGSYSRQWGEAQHRAAELLAPCNQAS